MLHRMQLKGYLVSKERKLGRSIRRSYRATAAGKVVLADAKRKVQELFAELFEE
jgi:DNA-binding PadR family transcriptional regulator